MVKHGSKKIRSKLNLNRKMKENKFENLENEVHELIKLSQQLKEVNEHLSKKNLQLSKENPLRELILLIHPFFLPLLQK